jgi:hypothetical protein
MHRCRRGVGTGEAPHGRHGDAAGGRAARKAARREAVCGWCGAIADVDCAIDRAPCLTRSGDNAYAMGAGAPRAALPTPT